MFSSVTSSLTLLSYYAKYPNYVIVVALVGAVVTSTSSPFPSLASVISPNSFYLRISLMLFYSSVSVFMNTTKLEESILTMLPPDTLFSRISLNT